MTTTIRKGLVKAYDAANGRVQCHGDPRIYFWNGGKVRTTGDNESVCNLNSKRFDVTISGATAARLLPDFEFEVEYNEHGRVTRFAGERIVDTDAA